MWIGAPRSNAGGSVGGKLVGLVRGPALLSETAPSEERHGRRGQGDGFCFKALPSVDGCKQGTSRIFSFELLAAIACIERTISTLRSMFGCRHIYYEAQATPAGAVQRGVRRPQ